MCVCFCHLGQYCVGAIGGQVPALARHGCLLSVHHLFILRALDKNLLNTCWVLGMPLNPTDEVPALVECTSGGDR